MDNGRRNGFRLWARRRPAHGCATRRRRVICRAQPDRAARVSSRSPEIGLSSRAALASPQTAPATNALMNLACTPIHPLRHVSQSKICELLLVLWSSWTRGARVWVRRWATRQRCPRPCPTRPEGLAPVRRTRPQIHRTPPAARSRSDVQPHRAHGPETVHWKIGRTDGNVFVRRQKDLNCPFLQSGFFPWFASASQLRNIAV